MRPVASQASDAFRGSDAVGTGRRGARPAGSPWRDTPPGDNTPAAAGEPRAGGEAATARFIVGDVFEAMAAMPDRSVDLILTAAPFLQLRSYQPREKPV